MPEFEENNQTNNKKIRTYQVQMLNHDLEDEVEALKLTIQTTRL